MSRSSSGWTRVPSPPLRSPSPLGRFDDGVNHGKPVNALARSASCPPVSPPRVQSPNGPSPRLRPPLKNSIQASSMELQKIDCPHLQALLVAVTSELSRFVRALHQIVNPIMRMWSVPQRAARQVMREIALGFTNKARHLIFYFRAISTSSRNILNFLATCIKDSHGLSDFANPRDINTVVNELHFLKTQWMRLGELEHSFTQVLQANQGTLEMAMDPDNWLAGSPSSKPFLELADSHNSVSICCRRVFIFFDALAVSSWNPPFLSPQHVKEAAGAWKKVEAGGYAGIIDIRRLTRLLLGFCVAGRFIKQEDADAQLTSLETGIGQEERPKVGERPDLARPSTTLGWRVGPLSMVGQKVPRA